MTELTIDQALQKGIEAHKAGQIQEADRLYTAILKAQPKHPDANHNMGVLAVGVGKVKEALPFFKTALEATPNTAQFWLSYIDALINLGKLTDAKAIFDQAKSIGAKGNGFDKLERQLQDVRHESILARKLVSESQSKQPNILDTIKLDQAIRLAKKKNNEGSIEEARRIYQDILNKFPRNKRASNGLKELSGGLVGTESKAQDPSKKQLQALINLYSQGQLHQSLQEAENLVQRFPQSAILFNIQGAILKGLRQLDQSVEAYNKALSIKPAFAEAHNNMGVVLQQQGKLEAAIESYNKALAIKPNYAEAWNNIGNALKDQGKLEETMGAYNKVLAIKPDYAEAYYNMGNVLKEHGKLEEAIDIYSKALAIKPDYAETYYNMSNALKEQGKLEETIEACSKALAIKPDYTEAYYNIGVTLQEQGKLEKSIEAYNKVLAIKPDYAEAHNNTGIILKEQGELEEAIEAYNKALSIKPDYAEAYHNMGVTLQEQSKLKEAIEAYNKALSIKPNYAEAYHNMGVTLQQQGKLAEAIEACKKALTIKPKYAEAYHNMGVTLQQQGKLEEAIEAYKKALNIKPDYTEVYRNMGNALNRVVFNQPKDDLQKHIISLLDNKSFARPKDIAVAAISLLKLEPKLERHLQTCSTVEVAPKLHEIIADLHELPLLLKLMSVCPLPDLELENLFQELRASLLLSASDRTGSPKQLMFQSALALQCFTNEYIYNQSEHENEALSALQAAIKQTLSNGDQPSSQSILCLASYRPLYQHEWSSSLLITDEIKDVIIRQVVEPNQEAHLKSVLPVLEEITDEVSSKVRDQYEESPYPRWVNLGLRLQPAPISKVIREMKLKLFDDAIKGVETPNILIAGCGTGQHSIGTAARFKNSQLLAIDLSLSSLSYAKRKTEELGIQNIEYMQADILDVGKLGRQFDIVESSGVLHHMNNPLAGWKALTDSLKPGGLMKIGLYSELARHHIVKMRREISEAGVGSSVIGMKSFRTTVMKSDQSYHKKILYSGDFYSMSTLRDLLFHVQEHRFTMPQVKDCLSELGLNFCGFEEVKIVQHFSRLNTSPDDPYDLDKWEAYEEANPMAFAGMYQFWCQKI